MLESHCAVCKDHSLAGHLICLVCMRGGFEKPEVPRVAHGPRIAALGCILRSLISENLRDKGASSNIVGMPKAGQADLIWSSGAISIERFQRTVVH